jgi:hypothetical protein
MQNNYVKNKLLFSLGACAILLGLTDSSALAQQKYPTEAQIQQAKVNLRQQIQSSKNSSYSNYLKDYRTPEQIQNRKKFVSAWQQIEPGIAPFLGSWGDIEYEAGWTIYPSTVKNQVCVAMSQAEGAVLYVGKINNGNIHLSSGSVIFPEGKYLGVTYFQDQQNYTHLLNDPTVPRAPSPSDEYIDETFDPSSLLQAYKQAGCTASLPSKPNTMTWQELKTYVKQKKPPSLEGMIPDQFPNQFANGKIAITRLHPGLVGYVVAKEGVNIPNLSNLKELSETDVSFNSVGLENAVELPAVVGSTDSLYNSSQLIAISYTAARYDSEGLRDEARKSEQTTLPNGKKAYYLKSAWCSFRDESTEYSDYLCVSIANSPKTSLEVLKSISASNLNTTTQVSQVKMPDSLKLTLEQKGGNTETEFIKGDDGYYKWFVKKEGFLASLTNSIFNSLTNNTSGTCLGLKENQDLAKVKLTTYPCNSPEGSRKWEILMVNDNTGYKIKLPNTKYCLGANVGVLECDSSDATVENLTPEQYKEFTGRIMPEKKETTLTASNLGCSQNTDNFPDLGNLPWKKRLDYCSSIYAYSGILFDSLTPEKQENGTTKLKMEVFNRGSADALIEIYNSTGNLEDIKIIEGNRPPSDLINSGHDLFTKVPASFFSKYPVDDHRHNLTKQSIEIIIPSGGSVKITKSSNYASLYNVAMTALEISQLKSGNPGFTKSDTVKKLIKGFIKESGNKSAINIFTSEPALQGVFSLDFLDKNKLAEVLYELVKYSSKVEKDPTKNPFLGAFKDVYIDAASIGIENALYRYINPGLGIFVKGVRVGGNAANTFARSWDYYNAMSNGDKSTIVLEDK